MERELQIEVLVNSPGPHDRVRVTEPFGLLKSCDVDVRIHRAPFHLPSTIRPHSLVIWQRPLPESWQQQMNILRWVRDRGCLLVTEWDDHPDLFPVQIRKQLNATNMAALRCCHIIQTSSSKLGEALKAYNPYCIIIENATELIPPINLKKHNTNKPRVFIGNQNRGKDHKQLIQGLNHWCNRDRTLRIVIIQDRELAEALPKEQVEFDPTTAYDKYRSLLRGCQIALMPLSKTNGNACKTPIKWIEAASESVVCVGGPELYSKVFNPNKGILVGEQQSIPYIAEKLWEDSESRCRIATEAHRCVKEQHQLIQTNKYRHWMYNQIWRKRRQLDKKLLERQPKAKTNLPFKS